MTFDVESFSRGFVARLIEKDVTAIQPQRPNDRHGFHLIVRLLDNEVRRLRDEGCGDEDWYRQLVRLRNALHPSNSGAFDNFETALRDLQLSLTSAPNAFYEEIAFSVSKPYAEALFRDMPSMQQELVAKAVEAFLDARTDALSEPNVNDHESGSSPTSRGKMVPH